MNVFDKTKAHTKFPKGRIEKTIERRRRRRREMCLLEATKLAFTFFRPVELIKWMEFLTHHLSNACMLFAS